MNYSNNNKKNSSPLGLTYLHIFITNLSITWMFYSLSYLPQQRNDYSINQTGPTWTILSPSEQEHSLKGGVWQSLPASIPSDCTLAQVFVLANFHYAEIGQCTFAREISLPWDCFLSRMSHTPGTGNVQLAPSPLYFVLFHLHFHWERDLHKVCKRREAEGWGISLGQNKEMWNTFFAFLYAKK